MVLNCTKFTGLTLSPKISDGETTQSNQALSEFWGEGEPQVMEKL